MEWQIRTFVNIARSNYRLARHPVHRGSKLAKEWRDKADGLMMAARFLKRGQVLSRGERVRLGLSRAA